MSKIKSFLKSEFVIGMKPFDWIFIGIGILLQIIAIVLSLVVPAMHDDMLVVSAISGIAGCISVVLCSRGKLSQYFFGYIQLIPYLILATNAGLSGEVVENWFYTITMIFGIVSWIKKYKHAENVENAVETKNMTKSAWIITGIIASMAIILVGVGLSNATSFSIWLTGKENPEPWLDSITTVVPLVGQMLMCLRYSDQWIFWFVEDVISIIMWAMLGNWVMVAQYIFWTANTVYGYLNWRKLAKSNIEEKE